MINQVSMNEIHFRNFNQNYQKEHWIQTILNDLMDEFRLALRNLLEIKLLD